MFAQGSERIGEEGITGQGGLFPLKCHPQVASPCAGVFIDCTAVGLLARRPPLELREIQIPLKPTLLHMTARVPSQPLLPSLLHTSPDPVTAYTC